MPSRLRAGKPSSRGQPLDVEVSDDNAIAGVLQNGDILELIFDLPGSGKAMSVVGPCSRPCTS